MKVLVISEERMRQLGIGNDLLAMTAIDVPDGCALAVVVDATPPQAVLKAIDYLLLPDRGNYRRVIQEVKL